VGLATAAGGLRRLRRAGVFGGVFWHSLPHYPRYRVRALRPLLATLGGLALLAAGAALALAGVATYYADHLGHLTPAR
jgi:hypothetical protein